MIRSTYSKYFVEQKKCIGFLLGMQVGRSKIHLFWIPYKNIPAIKIGGQAGMIGNLRNATMLSKPAL
jgi:hypothetical protein